MKSRSNCCNKAKNQMFVAETVINYCSMEACCDLCLNRLDFLKSSIIESHNKIGITTKSD